MVAVACSALLAGVATAQTRAPATDGDVTSDPGAASAPAVRVHAPGRTFTLAAVGDFLSEGLVNNAAAASAPPGVRFDYEPLLRPVAPLLTAADLAICHMETPIGAPGAQVGFAGKSGYGTNLIAAAAELPSDLTRVGFDRCSTASNHANDLGADGVRTTLDALDGAGLSHTGTARSAEEAAPRVLDVAGVRVGHVAFARNSNTGFPADWWRVRQGVTADNVIDDVAALRAAGAEVVIVSLHVYVELQSAPTAEDRAVVRDIIAGAHPDLIIIHGPHVVQPVERVDGTLVFWSLGNFISGMGVADRGKYADPRTLDGLLATVRFSERADGSWATTPWTVLLCNVLGSRVVYPGLTTLADPTTPAGVRSQLEACVGRSAAVVADLH
jgi:poly-gamma-glutamate synthesis protein (capsule biosynthesis protein)